MTTLDLKAVGRILIGRVGMLSDEGFEVSALTWRDRGADWPYPFVSSPEEAIEADSVGIHVKGESAEGQLVFFAGGWADVSLLAIGSGDFLVEAPTAISEADVEDISTQFASLFLKPERSPESRFTR